MILNTFISTYYSIKLICYSYILNLISSLLLIVIFLPYPQFTMYILFEIDLILIVTLTFSVMIMMSLFVILIFYFIVIINMLFDLIYLFYLIVMNLLMIIV
jgi:hypothetical protein